MQIIRSRATRRRFKRNLRRGAGLQRRTNRTLTDAVSYSRISLATRMHLSDPRYIPSQALAISRVNLSMDFYPWRTAAARIARLVPTMTRGAFCRPRCAVAPQYASTLGKTANCQTFVWLTLAGDEVLAMVQFTGAHGSGRSTGAVRVTRHRGWPADRLPVPGRRHAGSLSLKPRSGKSRQNCPKAGTATVQVDPGRAC